MSRRESTKGTAAPDFKVTEIDRAFEFDRLEHWDVVIIGAGPAGLAAGLTTAHRGLTTLIIEAKESAGGQPQFLYADKRIVDIPGFPEGITGEELSQRTYQQAVDALVQFRFQHELLAIDDTDRFAGEEPLLKVVTSKGEFLCRKAILACGLLHRPRTLPVFERFDSAVVHYKFPRIADYTGKRVVVVGGGDSAFDAAVMALQRGGRVDILVRNRETVAKATSVARVRELGGVIHLETEAIDARSDGAGIELTLSDGRRLPADVVIVQIGFFSAKETFERLNLRLNDDGSVAIDRYFETSRKGIFAVGDVHGDIKLIVVAWAEGIQAAIYAFKEIVSPYWLNDKRLRDCKAALIQEKLAEAAAGRQLVDR